LINRITGCGDILELTAKEMKEILESDIPVMVEFWGSWCPPCQQMKQILEELGGKYGDQIAVAKINIDRNPGIASKYDIKGVPTYIVFKRGKIIYREVGAKSKEQLEDIIKKVI